jgi:hypothetical protein
MIPDYYPAAAGIIDSGLNSTSSIRGNTMKKTVLLICLTWFTHSALGQGEVIFASSPVNKVSTNSPYGTGLTATVPNGFYYALFIAPVGTTDFASFAFTGDYATNTALAGRLYGYNVPNRVTPLTTGACVVNGWLPGTTMSYIISGWSSNLGHDWSVIASELATGNWANIGFFGISTIGQATAGGIAGGPLPAPPLMGPGQGVVLQLDSFSIGLVTPLATPEPRSLTIFVFGTAIAFWLRRR